MLSAMFSVWGSGFRVYVRRCRQLAFKRPEVANLKQYEIEGRLGESRSLLVNVVCKSS